VIVRRIFEAYAAGLSPRKIAMQLNKEGVPGPFGRPWRDTAVRGHITRGTGILNNELYIGIRIWNRLRYVKDPVSGRRRSRLNPPELWIVNEVPELRIVDDELWDAVKRRQSSIRESEGVSKARATRFWERRRAQHLLTGLVYCGSCGGRMASVGRDYLACSAARGRGTCTNRASIRRGPLEDLILEGLRHNLMTGKEVETFIAAFHAELNAQRAARTAGRAGQERELAEVRRKLDGLIDAIAEGMRAPGLQQRLDELEARRAALEQALSEEAPPLVRLHPNLAQVYRAKVERLHEALADPGLRDEALGILRGLIERVVIHPAQDGFQVEIVGEIVRMVELSLDAKKAALSEEAACSVKVVAGAGNQRCFPLVSARELERTMPFGRTARSDHLRCAGKLGCQRVQPVDRQSGMLTWVRRGTSAGPAAASRCLCPSALGRQAGASLRSGGGPNPDIAIEHQPRGTGGCQGRLRLPAPR
jgi:site-specific DNA recombinase